MENPLKWMQVVMKWALPSARSPASTSYFNHLFFQLFHIQSMSNGLHGHALLFKWLLLKKKTSVNSLYPFSLFTSVFQRRRNVSSSDRRTNPSKICDSSTEQKRENQFSLPQSVLQFKVRAAL